MIEIAIANFTTNDKDFAYAYDGLWQWHYGQILRIQGLKLPTAVEIHFSLQETGGEAKIRIGTTKDGVTDVVIPDFIFEKETASNYNAYAFVYIRDDTSGQTVYKIKMQVKARPKPEAHSTADQSTMAAILAAVTGIADGKADGLTYENSILKLMSGQAELARVTITGGSGREIELQKGDTAIQWRYVGDEAWTDLVLLEEIRGKNAAIDATLTIQGMAADAKAVGDKLERISEAIDDLKQNGTGTGNGVTTAQATSLWAIIQKSAFTEVLTSEELNAFKTAWGIADSGEEEPDEPTEPDNPEVTLTSISATYTGGEVATGTPLTDLTGITVTATYSDGTTKTVTGYTLSGEILEGENTITVSYVEKTTTFTVVGVSESVSDEYELYVELTSDDFVVGGLTSKCQYSYVGYNIARLSYLDTTSSRIAIESGYTYKVEFEGNLSNIGVQQYNQTIADIIAIGTSNYNDGDKKDSTWQVSGYEFTQVTINELPAVSIMLTMKNSTNTEVSLDDLTYCRIFRKAV